MKATKTVKAVRPSVINYDVKTPIGIVHARLVAAKGKPVTKAALYKNIAGKNPSALLSWVKIHGLNSGLWRVEVDGEKETVTLTMNKKRSGPKPKSERSINLNVPAVPVKKVAAKKAAKKAVKVVAKKAAKVAAPVTAAAVA